MWATTSGDAWSRRWRETDRGLARVGEQLLSAITASAPAGRFNAFEIGCGPGPTCIAVAEARPDARITACDISPALVDIARVRTANLTQVRVLLGDAEELAEGEEPFDVIFSRHGVMFFPDPVAAFSRFRAAANPGASLIFSCFRSWQSNPWVWELTGAAAGAEVQPPGREPGGFAFADPDHVHNILTASGWEGAPPEPVDFTYVTGEGEDAIEDALSFVLEIGPAARLVQSLPKQERPAAVERIRRVIERQYDGASVGFPAAAWIWNVKTRFAG
nr:methyltransferase domain-containing protein [Sphingomonas sp.]